MLLHIMNSHMAIIKYHMHYPIFMACTGAAVIFMTSNPYTVWTSVTYQAVSPTNNLAMWLKLTRNIFFLLCLSPLNMSLFPAEPCCPKFEVNQINTTYVLHSIGNSPSDLKPVEWELGTRTLCSSKTYTHGHTYLKHEKINYEVDWSSHKCYILQPQTEASGVRAGHTYFSEVKPAL